LKGNWQVDAQGTIAASKDLNLLTLTGANSIIGLAVVVHNMTDNCTDISSAGKRIGWGVIGIANVAGNTAVNSKYIYFTSALAERDKKKRKSYNAFLPKKFNM